MAAWWPSEQFGSVSFLGQVSYSYAENEHIPRVVAGRSMPCYGQLVAGSQGPAQLVLSLKVTEKLGSD